MRNGWSFLSMVAVVGLSGCAAEAVGVDDEGTIQVAFDMRPAEDAGFRVDKVDITFQHRETDETIHEIIRPSGNAASTELRLTPGQWDITVELLDGEELAGSGEGTAVVLQGFITQIAIEIELAMGGVHLTVKWKQNFGGPIADLSDRPIHVEISGIGTYMVHGLSRIGWDIEVIGTPTSGGRTHKDPGRVTFPDIAMVNLTTSSQAEADALVDWMNDPDPRSVEFIDVRGLGGQTARIAVFDAVAVDGNTHIVEETSGHFTVAGVRIGHIRTIELTGWQDLQFYPRCPAPGHWVEISGVTGDPTPCYPPGVLRLPAVGSSSPLLLPAVRSNEARTLFEWAEAIRRDIEAFGCVGCGNESRRSGSVIDRDADDNETGRINFFEVWPSNFTLFNPTRRYGHTYLFDIVIQNDVIERA